MPAGSSPCSSTMAGTPPGYVADAGRKRRSLRIRSRSSSIAHRVDEPLQPGAQLVVAVAVVVLDPEDRLDGGEEVLAGGELLERLRRVRVGAEAAGHEHLEAGLDGAVGARSLHRDHADVVEHRLAAVGGAAREVDLELAGEALRDRVAQEEVLGGLGPRARCRAPRRGRRRRGGSPATLRTVSPHASRLVSPTEASSRSASPACSSCTKWNWTFWRVVRWPQPRE